MASRWKIRAEPERLLHEKIEKEAPTLDFESIRRGARALIEDSWRVMQQNEAISGFAASKHRRGVQILCVVCDEYERKFIADAQRDCPDMGIHTIRKYARSIIMNTISKRVRKQKGYQRRDFACARLVTSDQPLHFFSLPIELRNRVYELVLIPDRDGGGGVTNSRAIVVAGMLEKRATDWVQQPYITQVSKTLREETLPIYYGSNHFVISAHSSLTRCFLPPGSGPTPGYFHFAGAENWLRQIGKHNINMTKNLELTLPISVDTFNADQTFYREKIDSDLELWKTLLPTPVKFLATVGSGFNAYHHPIGFEQEGEDGEATGKQTWSKDSLAYRRCLDHNVMWTMESHKPECRRRKLEMWSRGQVKKLEYDRSENVSSNGLTRLQLE